MYWSIADLADCLGSIPVNLDALRAASILDVYRT